MAFLAVHEKGLEYVSEVITDKEYRERYGGLSDYNQPRCRRFDTIEEAQEYQVRQEKIIAHQKYG